jgi:hypothetical protein
MFNFIPDTTNDFQLLTAKYGKDSVSILVRTKDGFISVSPNTGETEDRMVANYQRIIDNIIFTDSSVIFTDIASITGFNYYTPDYVLLSDVTVL